MRKASPELGPWAALLLAFHATLPLLIANRPLSEPRRHVIVGSPALQGRELAKAKLLTAQLADALQVRGIPARTATLAAHMGMFAYSQAATAWLDGEPGGLEKYLARAFREMHELSSFS